jgi:MacB-like periplasmic core domain/FtsX-like permease family
MDRLLQDLRYGIRTFVRQPAFSLTAILALALGIGANTAVFSVVYGVLLKPLPYPDPGALIYMHDTYPAVTFASVSAAKYLALRSGNRSLEALGAHTPGNVTLTGGAEPEQVPGSRVSAEMFEVMRVPALHGRWFSSEEDLPNSDSVIVISHSLWQRRFGSDQSIVGSVITVDGQSRTVVGIMPPGFTYPGRSQAWIPLALAPTVAPGGNFLRLVGRMRPGVTVLLSLAGAAVGVLLGGWVVRLFVTLAPASFPRVQTISIDPWVLAFTLVLATVTGLVFGMAPAFRGFRTDPNDALRDMGARVATSSGARGASRVLVAAEVALALMLVVGAGLMVKSLLKLQEEDAGFRAEGLMTFELTLPAVRYPGAAPAEFIGRMLEEIRALPGVQAAGAINYIPLANFGFNGVFRIEGRPPFPRDSAPVVEFRAVTPGYFATMGIAFRRGQDFTTADNAAGRPVVIINQAMADRYWPGEDPIGARLQLSADTGSISREIVGVVGSVRSWQMNTPPVPETYLPHMQAQGNSMGIVVRTTESNPAIVVPAIRQRVAAADPNLPMIRVRPMETIVESSTGGTRLSSTLTAMFALVAALLASLGIYSLIAYSVAQRTREIGIRIALGADRRAVARLVVGEGIGLAAVGLVLGTCGAMLLTRTLETLLYEVSPTDPAVFAMTCAGVLVVAALASLLPAIRALRVDPAVALRGE